MNEQNIPIELTIEVSVNGVVIPDASVTVKKVTVVIDEINVAVPNVTVSQGS